MGDNRPRIYSFIFFNVLTKYKSFSLICNFIKFFLPFLVASSFIQTRGNIGWDFKLIRTKYV